MSNAFRLGTAPTRSLTVAVVFFFVLSSALVVWLVSDLDRNVASIADSLTEMAGIEAPPIDRSTVHRIRMGIVVLGSFSMLFVVGMIVAFSRLSRRKRRHLAEAFRRALEGSADDDGDTDATDGDVRFDGTPDSARRLGRAFRSHQRERSVGKARLAKVAELIDVGVLLFSSERTPELASATAMRFLASSDPLPAPPLVDRIFGAFGANHEELPDQATAELEIAGEGRAVHLRLQLFHLDETCDHGYLVLVRDHRVLEALDTDLRLATQLRAMSRLYLGVAHDLKAPLNAMGLNLSLLRDSLAMGDDEEDRKRRQWLTVVEVELARLRREAERLLAQTAPSREEVDVYDLGALLTRIRDLLQPQARHQLARVELSLPDEPLHARGREDLVQQALLNVAINALEATPEGEVMRLSLVRDEGWAFVRVRDHGAGIPEANRDHIFEIHFTTKEHGTGIGLYIAQSILEAEGGTLVLKQTSDDGTVLESTLPLV